MSFPNSPSNGQTATVNGITYVYNSTVQAWTRSAALSGNISFSNVSATGLVTAGAFFWANGTPFASSSYGNTQVTQYLTGNVTTGNLTTNGIFWPNGMPFASSSYSNLTVAQYLPSYVGTIGNVTTSNQLVVSNTNTATSTTSGALTVAGGVGIGGNLWVGGNLFITGNTTTVNYETVLYKETANVITANLVSVTGNITANNIAAINNSNANSITCSYLTVTANATVANAVITSGNIGTTRTQIITTGANTTSGTITGNWTLTSGSRFNATYADLAERFEADTMYDAGTVVELGGVKEITAVKYELSEDVFGVISDSAAYLMNAGAGTDTTHPPVAVGGRVKVKVMGQVRKNQRLVSAGSGIARAALPGEATAFNVIGRSLEDKMTDDIGTVEAFVKIN